ncbi:MAG: hypothetical protein JWL59_1430, partial [Chthoniobacteraceae bacterium]|nr:hypothetical protein [Chthoniobacteraceae bacterium]
MRAVIATMIRPLPVPSRKPATLFCPPKRTFCSRAASLTGSAAMSAATNITTFAQRKLTLDG